MATLCEFINACNAFQQNSCDNEGVFNIEKYRDCVLMISEPEYNEKARYFIDYVGPYVFCKDSNIFFIPTPGTKVFAEACESIFNTEKSVFSIPVVSGKDSDLSDFNHMLDTNEDFSKNLEMENKKYIYELFTQLMNGINYPTKTYEESLEMCIRQCSELGLNDEVEQLKTLNL